MSYRGKVTNGVVVLDNGSTLPDGTLVRVEPIEELEPSTADAEAYARQMLEIAGTAGGLPPDLARNHDHYLHGHPKK